MDYKVIILYIYRKQHRYDKQRMENQKSAPKLGRAPPQKRVSIKRHLDNRVQFGFEKAKLEKVMKWFSREAMRRRNKFLWFRDIEWGTRDKIEKIMTVLYE